MTRRASRAVSGNPGPRDETSPWDEQPWPETGGADPLATGRDAAGRVRSSDAARALASLPRRGRYLPREIVCAEDFKPYDGRRADYIEGRRSELTRAWGALSRGVCAMLYAESWLWAGAEYAAEKGARTGEIDHFKTAGTLAMQAKQLAAAAWELASRESKAREADPEHKPWFVPAKEGGSP